jgi:hypothetical protein
MFAFSTNALGGVADDDSTGIRVATHAGRHGKK